MPRKSIETHTLHFSHLPSREVTGERIGHFLLWEESQNRPFRIAHIPSGYGVYSPGFRTYRHAVAFAKALNAIAAPWASITEMDVSSFDADQLAAVQALYLAETER